jgi:hypothetical protein
MEGQWISTRFKASILLSVDRTLMIQYLFLKSFFKFSSLIYNVHVISS